MTNKGITAVPVNRPATVRFTARLRQILDRVAPFQAGATVSTPDTAPPPSERRRRPAALVESLESRLCPSVTVAVGNLSGHAGESLHISGPDSGQHVIITEDSAHGRTTVQVDANGDGLFTGPGEFDQTFNEAFAQIKIKLKHGSSNTVDYFLSSDMSGADRDFRLQMGHGTNVFNFDARGHAVENNTFLTFAVRAGSIAASEKVHFTFGTIDDSEVDLGIKLGSGTHTVTETFNGAIQNNSLVQSDLKLGDGVHAVAVDLLGDISNSSVHVNTTGGDTAQGHDNVAYFVGGTISHDALLDIGMALHNGDDTGQIHVSGKNFAVLDTSRVYFTIDGGEGSDTINYGTDGTGGTIAVDGLVDALLTGADGNDRINVNFPQSAAVDLTGTFRVEADGNDGRDVINAVLSNTAASNGSYDVLLLGGDGDDAFTLTNNDPTGTGILYDYFGLDVVDGGSGHNVATLTGDGIETRHIDR